MTLTHTNNTPWADSSGKPPEHNGLTDFGKQVVREMNRLGMMVDISHVSDKTFYDALETSVRARDRVAFFGARSGQRPAQYDGRHAARAGR